MLTVMFEWSGVGSGGVAAQTACAKFTVCVLIRSDAMAVTRMLFSSAGIVGEVAAWSSQHLLVRVYSSRARQLVADG
jgi:hypothetical protein